jgi:hypothetical protein
MAVGVVRVEGKSVTLDQEIIDAGVETIRAALSVDFPDIENAEIQIEAPSASSPVRTATVVKRGMGKGSGLTHAQAYVVERLAAAPEYVNPACALAAEVLAAEAAGDLAACDRALSSGRLVRAVEEGEREGRACMRALGACGHGVPQPSKEVPEGF